MSNVLYFENRRRSKHLAILILSLILVTELGLVSIFGMSGMMNYNLGGFALYKVVVIIGLLWTIYGIYKNMFV